MKKILPPFLVSLLFISNNTNAQLTIGAGTQVKGDNNSYIVLYNLDMVHNGAAFEPVLKFTGNNNVHINSDVAPVFSRIMLAKVIGTKVSLQKKIEVSQYINFSSGTLDLNGHDIELQSTALLQNESVNSYINSTAGGVITIDAVLNAPVAANPGNLGAMITSTANMGNVKIARGHAPRLMNASNQYSIARFYTVTPVNNQNLNATLRIYYMDHELNGRPEDLLGIWRSDNGGNSFQSLELTGRSTGLNYVEKTGIPSLAMHTLFDAQAILPVTNWQFTAKRINSDVVKLDWSTTQESNNHGFHIERKREQDAAFSTIGFAPSLAPNGNSSNLLNYTRNDNNNYTGKTYYRLKQEDLDGQFAVSAIRMVTGENSKTVVLKAWPIPAQGHFFVSVEGIEKDMLLVYDASGKLQQQSPVSGHTQHQVDHLPAGTYILRLASQKDIQQRVIVQ
jgi:hypothetical protein